MKRILSGALSALVFLAALSGCADSGLNTAADATRAEQDSSSEQETAQETEENEAYVVQTDADMFTDRDSSDSYDESDSVLIALDGDSVTSSSDSVVISGSTVKISEEATYILSGELDDGMIIVDAQDTAKIQLVLNGVSINSETSAPLYILEADKVFVTLADGTDNCLSNVGTFTAIDENNIDGAVFSKQDLTFNGSGTLTVTSEAGHGIVCKDDLVITGGTYIINSASHGIDANDSVRITGDTSLSIYSGKDGIHAENSDDESLGFVYISSGTFEIDAQGDGISAGSYMQIASGSFDILAGGGSVNESRESSESWGMMGGGRFGGRGDFGGGGPGEGMQPVSNVSSSSASDSTSMKGIKAGGELSIYGGSFVIDSADDAVHSNSSVMVTGGEFEIASGDDAFHADDTLSISSGTINITESYEGLEALHLEISGGDISLVASDDGLNAAGGVDSSGMTGGRDGMFGGGGFGGRGNMGGGMSSSGGTIVISGGTLYVNASGDGLDANGTIEISGGYTTVVGPTQGDTATLDYDTTATITGGTFVGTGASSGMVQTFSGGDQGVITASVGNQSAATPVVISDSDANVLLSFEPQMSYGLVIYSSPEVVSGETYTVSAGTANGQVTAK
ncbi:MAG TPA: carbohydrate-binding domain-containing protein [Candidatus Faeciplasma gallinarum]|uniref:Carbohydrate-binding domain-containing protein n=1 Tax=Candidatus Faeciplasma gallinarum TaxID=2840799 RepID=A0A9D1ENY7_9FIRM|nr:carbohydrate-binding domain-containing protein [Candidatus Faeciplasma gallinarum]